MLCSLPGAQVAMEEMLLSPQEDGSTLASKFQCLILDNASIHKDKEFLLKLKTHIQVKFIPPYCYHLSPLDNGAYGYVVGFLKANSDFYADKPIEVALDAGFRSVGGDAARMCFHNCRYHFAN